MNAQKIISVLNQKGGTGKSVISINMACGLQQKGFRVAIIDTDIQGTALDWQARADDEGVEHPKVFEMKTTSAFNNGIDGLNPNIDYVIVDGSPRVNEFTSTIIRASNFVLIPVQPSPYDIWATADIVRIIKERQIIANNTPKCAFLLSMIMKNTKLLKESIAPLHEYEIPVLDSFTTKKEAYRQCQEHGNSIYAYKGKGSPSKEIDLIIEEIMEKYL